MAIPGEALTDAHRQFLAEHTKLHADPQRRRVDVRIDRLVSFDLARLPEAGGRST